MIYRSKFSCVFIYRIRFLNLFIYSSIHFIHGFSLNADTCIAEIVGYVFFFFVVEYNARTETVRFAAWVPGLTNVLRRRRWSQVIKVLLGESGAAIAMVVDHCMVDRVPTINRQTTLHRPGRQHPYYRCAVSSPGNSTSGLVYRCLSQGRN